MRGFPRSNGVMSSGSFHEGPRSRFGETAPGTYATNSTWKPCSGALPNCSDSMTSRRFARQPARRGRQSVPSTHSMCSWSRPVVRRNLSLSQPRRVFCTARYGALSERSSALELHAWTPDQDWRSTPGTNAECVWTGRSGPRAVSVRRPLPAGLFRGRTVLRLHRRTRCSRKELNSRLHPCQDNSSPFLRGPPRVSFAFGRSQNCGSRHMYRKQTHCRRPTILAVSHRSSGP